MIRVYILFVKIHVAYMEGVKINLRAICAKNNINFGHRNFLLLLSIADIHTSTYWFISRRTIARDRHDIAVALAIAEIPLFCTQKPTRSSPLFYNLLANFPPKLVFDSLFSVILIHRYDFINFYWLQVNYCIVIRSQKSYSFRILIKIHIPK